MTKGAKPADGFTESESVPESRAYSFGEDVDYSIDVGVKEADNVGELASDLSELKTWLQVKNKLLKKLLKELKRKKLEKVWKVRALIT